MGYYKTYFNIVDKQVGAFVLYAAFFDFLKVKFGGDKSKTRRTFTEAVNHVKVQAALTAPYPAGQDPPATSPEEQQALYSADLIEDS